MTFGKNAERILQRNLDVQNTKKNINMKGIKIRKKQKEKFLRAVRALNANVEELVKIDDKNFDHFFINATSQQDIFDLSYLYATYVLLDLKQQKLF
jgi:hypothetical protein